MALSVRWWLEKGDEQCRFCLRMYPWEDQRRCTRCDIPLCCLCGRRGEGKSVLLCPGCSESDAG